MVIKATESVDFKRSNQWEATIQFTLAFQGSGCAAELRIRQISRINAAKLVLVTHTQFLSACQDIHQSYELFQPGARYGQRLQDARQQTAGTPARLPPTRANNSTPLD